jgi:tellurite methyltransferase
VNPHPIVSELVPLCPAGARVLDVGAGTGRNAIFLARSGFAVDAVDSSAADVAAINDVAGADSLPLQAAVRDLNVAIPDGHGYGVVVCTLVLHLLTPARANALLASLRGSASPGTLHAIAAITSEGDFVHDFAPGERYYPTPGLVAREYEEAGWELHVALDEEMPMKQKNPDGTRRVNTVSLLIASKRAELRADAFPILA